MPYTIITFGSAKTQLADRLDKAKVFWKDAELGLLIVEAMRTWNVMTGYWRKRIVLPTVSTQPFYDLPSQATLAATHSFTLKDRDLINDMQYSLIENVNNWGVSTAWAGTDMFDMAQFTRAIERRRNQFLLEAGTALTLETIAVAPPPIGRIPLPEAYIDVRRAAWRDSFGVFSVLFRDDEWAMNAFKSGWAQTPARPRVMSIAAAPQITLQVAPVPLDAGMLQVIVVKTGATLDPVAGIVLGVQDDFAWIIRYGAMADLLSQEGEARDVQRAEYCESRYQQGVNLARTSTGLMEVQVNDVPVRTDALYDWDTFQSEWQNSVGQPRVAALPGFSMLALNPVPNAVFGISADAVIKAPVPVLDADPIDIGREDLEAILNLAEHAGSFKQGGSEFSQGMALYKAAEESAKVYNSRIEEFSLFSEQMKDRARQEADKRPSRLPRPTEVVNQ